VYYMENILDLHTQPADAYCSLVCSDKTSKRSIDEVVTPQVVQLEQTLRCDYEYVHNGQHIYVFCAVFSELALCQGDGTLQNADMELWMRDPGGCAFLRR